MTKRIIWSPKSERDLEIILNYLAQEWDNEVAVRFLDLIEHLLEQISFNPRQFPLIHKKLNIRKCYYKAQYIVLSKYAQSYRIA